MTVPGQGQGTGLAARQVAGLVPKPDAKPNVGNRLQTQSGALRKDKGGMQMMGQAASGHGCPIPLAGRPCQRGLKCQSPEYCTMWQDGVTELKTVAA